MQTGHWKNLKSVTSTIWDRSVGVTQAFLSSYYLFVDHLPGLLTPGACLVAGPRLKLLLETVEPFRIISTPLHTVTLDEDGIHETVSTIRVSMA